MCIRDRQCFDSFQKSQIQFYEDLLTAWDIPLSTISPQVVGNYLLSLIIVRNNAPVSLPFLFHEYLDETAALQIQLFIDHLAVSYTHLDVYKRQQ